MDINPMDQVADTDGPKDSAASRESSRLNAWVAITVALIATFTGVCQIKDNNICQSMQQAQADKLDHWAFYQARNIREEIANSTLTELRLADADAAPGRKAKVDSAIARYVALAADQAAKKDSLKTQADQDQKTYDGLNYRDDQFDLSDALIALAISLLALTALTQKRWLFWVALIPTALGVLMGLAGLFQWPIHPDLIAQMLS